MVPPVKRPGRRSRDDERITLDLAAIRGGAVGRNVQTHAMPSCGLTGGRVVTRAAGNRSGGGLGFRRMQAIEETQARDERRRAGVRLEDWLESPSGPAPEPLN